MTMGENEHMAYKIQYRYFHDYYLGCTYSGVEREPVVTTDIHALVCVCAGSLEKLVVCLAACPHVAGVRSARTELQTQMFQLYHIISPINQTFPSHYHSSAFVCTRTHSHPSIARSLLSSFISLPSSLNQQPPSQLHYFCSVTLSPNLTPQNR